VSRSRYLIGIDLGTTNTALAYVDRRSGRAATRVRLLKVPQITAPFELQPRDLLPSFQYLAGEHELPAGALELPFRGENQVAKTEAGAPVCVGAFAREQGAKVPGRLVASSKSWLCHAGVDRREPILPWGSKAQGLDKISPVEAARLLLAHLREAWNHTMGAAANPKKRFEAQEVIVTVPASFDAIARRLTDEAARAAGIESPILLEEPQAALYAWIGAHERELANQLPRGSRVLVVDIGGGTSDFAIVEVKAPEEDENASDGGADGADPSSVRLSRSAVSDHLLLGGDNMDLALARRIAPRLRRKQLTSADWQALRHACRHAKEELLAEGGPERATVALASRGTKLVGGLSRAELSREETVALVRDGFFPRVDLRDALVQQTEGLQELGLPFASDPAITRHLAAFLRRHAPGGADCLAPTHVLFNGGVMKSPALRAHVLTQIEAWTGTRPEELGSVGFDLAVSRGAAYYGLVRRERGIRILSGLARAYYVGLESQQGSERSLCVTPRGQPAEREVVVDPGLALLTNVPIKLRLFSSSARDDVAGAVLQDPTIETPDQEGDLRELPPLLTVVRSGKRGVSEGREVEVELCSKLTELGTLELSLRAKDGSERRWNLELSVRQEVQLAEGAADAATPPLSPEIEAKVRGILGEAFAGPTGPHGPLRGVVRALEEVIGAGREAWTLPQCRALFELIMDAEVIPDAARRSSTEHEARYLNLIGFTLRPGFGALLDDHRVVKVWRMLLGGLSHKGADNVQNQRLIMLRRIGGGLSRGQQEQVFGQVRDLLIGRGAKRAPKQLLDEAWRLAASFEHLSRATRKRLGNHLLEALRKRQGPPQWGLWALGRLGARAPVYGSTHDVVEPQAASAWLRELLARLPGAHPKGRERARFAVAELGRRTGDPARDLDGGLVDSAAEALEQDGAPQELVRTLREVTPRAPSEQRLLYGDSVPQGLRLAGEA
jgi:hypothetical protein